MKAGYRYLYIDDSVFSLDRIILSDNGQVSQRELVETSEMFKGFYVELSMDI
ncbi:MAG: hypothetical protein GKR87_04000 [Kiritimatiellae bacterium]|nr:hypothetical protein [Kiritimatiellia bacterium]